MSISAHGPTVDWRTMIDFVIVSSHLQPYVLDTQVKRGSELSLITDGEVIYCGGGSWTDLTDPSVLYLHY